VCDVNHHKTKQKHSDSVFCCGVNAISIRSVIKTDVRYPHHFLRSSTNDCQ